MDTLDDNILNGDAQVPFSALTLRKNINIGTECSVLPPHSHKFSLYFKAKALHIILRMTHRAFKIIGNYKLHKILREFKITVFKLGIQVLLVIVWSFESSQVGRF